MSKRRKKNIDVAEAMNKIDKNIETVVKNSEEANERLGSLVNNNKSNLAKIITVVTLLAALVTISGFTIKDIVKRIVGDPPKQYEIYLSSEYSKLEVKADTEMLATLNFDATSVSIAAYLNSVLDGDILEMEQKNETEWHHKVYFQNVGVYKVVATAIAPNGDVIEGYTEIEVIPPENRIDQIFEGINQFL